MDHLSDIQSSSDRKKKLEELELEIKSPKYAELVQKKNLLNFVCGRINSWCNAPSLSSKTELRIEGVNTNLFSKEDRDAMTKSLSDKGYSIAFAVNLVSVSEAKVEEKVEAKVEEKVEAKVEEKVEAKVEEKVESK